MRYRPAPTGFLPGRALPSGDEQGAHGPAALGGAAAVDDLRAEPVPPFLIEERRAFAVFFFFVAMLFSRLRAIMPRLCDIVDSL